jgi:long-chain acyl-CoA synthetase
MKTPLKTLNQAILAAMETYAERTCFKIKQGERYQSISYRQFEGLTFRMVRFLQSLDISRGERVAIAADNGVQWMVVYVATLLAGGVVAPLRASLAPDTLRFLLEDLGASLVVLDDEQLIQAASTSWLTENETHLPNLKTILVANEAGETLPGTISIAGVLAEADPLTSEARDAIRAHAESIKPEALATIHYTAGKTGQPKGAVFDQARLGRMRQHMANWFVLDEDDVAFTVQPWCCAISLAASLHYFLSGVANVLAERSQPVLENMRQTSPTVSLNPPYFYEQLYHAFMEKVTDLPEAGQEVFQWAVTQNREFRAVGSAASAELRESYTRADLTFFTRLRGQIGGRVRHLYSTDAVLPQNLADFFETIGLSVLNLYSLTEAGGFAAVSQPTARRSGSCGQAGPGFELRIADEGEVLIRGESVMREYWHRPAETQQALDADGWLHTGDLGYLDQDGYLYLTGLKQPLLVLSTGRKIMPTIIENALMTSPFIAQAVVFGAGRPYVSALIVPDLEALGSHLVEVDSDKAEDSDAGLLPGPLIWPWSQHHNNGQVSETSLYSRMKVLLDKVIADVNSQLDRWEQIKVYSILDQADEATLTEVARLRSTDRYQIAERYKSQLEAIYPPIPQVAEQAISQIEVSPERMRTLLEKENILDAWMADAGLEFLFKLARTRQIDAPSMVHICDAVATIAQMESEEKPLSTTFIVGEPAYIAHVLPPSQIQLLSQDHIRRMRHTLTTLAKMVDGQVWGYVVDKHGYVRGVHRLEVPLDEAPASFLLGPQFRHQAAISKQGDALVFFVPTGGKQVRVFADGQLVGRYANGDWSPENIGRVTQVVTHLAEQKNYAPALVNRILRCAFQMSEENLGAIFTVGHADAILKHADAPEISHFALVVGTELAHLSDRELINFARQDGATVIDAQGKFRGCMVLLRPDANTQAEIGSGKGARHSSAAKISAETQCLAITVSQDGPITIYDNGRRVLSL